MRGQIPGKNPICLFGKSTDGIKELLVIPSRDGKGLQICKNKSGFASVASKDVRKHRFFH